MLTKTATTLATFKESWPRNAPMKRVKSPDVEDNTVVLATLVRASAAFDKYCNQKYLSLNNKNKEEPIVDNNASKLECAEGNQNIHIIIQLLDAHV